MSARVWHNYNKRKSERGVSLFLALLVVLFASGYIVLNINIDSNRRLDQKAAQSAWLIEQVAEAARLFVRDADAGIGAAAPFNAQYNRTALCTTPRAITPATLIAGGYIRGGIGNIDAGGNFTTPLGQTIQIIAANSVIGGGCGATALSNVAASAYIILAPGANTVRTDITALTDAMIQRGLPIIAPRFNAANANISPLCGATGQRGTIQWNSGCLSLTQYNRLGAVAFGVNVIGLPAWLTFRGDNRAIFRFAQPENPQAQEMTTDLRMAPFDDVNGDGVQDTTLADGCIAEVMVRTSDAAGIAGGNPTASTNRGSGVCASQDDDALNDRRQNITNVAALSVDRTIVNPQAVDNVGGAPVAEAGAALRSTAANTITGNVRSFGNLTAGNTPTIAATTLRINGGSLTVSPGASGVAPRMRVTQSLTGGFLQTDNATASNTTTVNGTASVSNQTTVADMTVDGSSGTEGFLANSFGGTASRLSVSNNATVGGTMTASGATTIVGGTTDPFSLATVRMDSASAAFGNNLAVGNDLSIRDNATIGTINIGQCYGDCPDREVVNPPL